MTLGWERGEDVIAERFKKEEIPGTFKKKFHAKDDEGLVIEKHGEIYKELGSGEFAVSSLLDKDFTDLLVMDKSEKSLDRTLKRVWLKDEKRMDVHFEIKFKVFHADRFSRKLVKSRKRLFMEDVWADILSNLLYKKSLPEIKSHKITEFLEDDFCKKTKEEIENDMKKLFRDWGLILTYFSVDFIIPEEEKNREEHSEGEGRTSVEEVKEPPVERPAEEFAKKIESRIGKKSREEVADEMEKERLEEEVRMELEKEQEQKDTEAALEALKLKEIKDKQEILKKSEEKELGTAEEKEETAEELKKRLGELKQAKEVTEKKFYKKELSEEAFQRMMENFEEKIIEIETKLKSKKG